MDSRLGKSAHVKDLSKCECVSTNLGNKIFSKGERDNIEIKMCFGNEKETDFFLGNNNFDQLSYKLYGPLIKALKK